MLVKDIMTKNVITLPSNTSVGDAKKLMREHNIRRLPVVDNGKLVGIVIEARLERVVPKTTAPVLWQVMYLVQHTTLKDVMQKKVVTVDPDATVEQAVALAQRQRVGMLVVTRRGKILGVVTTNDFFYKILNPLLGIGEAGARLIVCGGGSGESAEKIIACINKLGIGLELIWVLRSPEADRKDIIIQLDTQDATTVIKELQNLGFSASVRPQ